MKEFVLLVPLLKLPKSPLDEELFPKIELVLFWFELLPNKEFPNWGLEAELIPPKRLFEVFELKVDCPNSPIVGAAFEEKFPNKDIYFKFFILIKKNLKAANIIREFKKYSNKKLNNKKDK